MSQPVVPLESSESPRHRSKRSPFRPHEGERRSGVLAKTRAARGPGLARRKTAQAATKPSGAGAALWRFWRGCASGVRTGGCDVDRDVAVGVVCINSTEIGPVNNTGCHGSTGAVSSRQEEQFAFNSGEHAVYAR